MEKPAGREDKGSYTVAYYTEEQQARLGVTREGEPVSGKLIGKTGPRWTYDSTVEKPAGVESRG